MVVDGMISFAKRAQIMQNINSNDAAVAVELFNIISAQSRGEVITADAVAAARIISSGASAAVSSDSFAGWQPGLSGQEQYTPVTMTADRQSLLCIPVVDPLKAAYTALYYKSYCKWTTRDPAVQQEYCTIIEINLGPEGWHPSRRFKGPSFYQLTLARPIGNIYDMLKGCFGTASSAASSAGAGVALGASTICNLLGVDDAHQQLGREMVSSLGGERIYKPGQSPETRLARIHQSMNELISNVGPVAAAVLSGAATAAIDTARTINVPLQQSASLAGSQLGQFRQTGHFAAQAEQSLVVAGQQVSQASRIALQALYGSAADTRVNSVILAGGGGSNPSTAKCRLSNGITMNVSPVVVVDIQGLPLITTEANLDIMQTVPKASASARASAAAVGIDPGVMQAILRPEDSDDSDSEDSSLGSNSGSNTPVVASDMKQHLQELITKLKSITETDNKILRQLLKDIKGLINAQGVDKTIITDDTSISEFKKRLFNEVYDEMSAGGFAYKIKRGSVCKRKGST